MKKPLKTANLTRRHRFLCRGSRRYHAGKERDSETGLYYYGARYLDSRTGRWLSGDPAMGEYVPSAPVNDEARKRNGNLPGQGGVFNYVNLHVYHYAGNNPVKYTDPNGESSKSLVERQIKAVAKVGMFLIENKGALQKIGAGAKKVAMGLGIAALGAGGGTALTVGSGGAGALSGVAIADAAVVAGGAIVGVGVKEVADGLAMLSSNSNSETGGGSRNNPQTQGDPNQTLVERNPNDTVKRVTQYDDNGNILREIRPEGSHGIEGPTVKEPTFNTNPNTGETFQNGWSYRPATDAEINLLR